jgi:hypothetical protein
MGAVVFLTYFLVAHPPASKAPVRIQAAANNAFMAQTSAELIAIAQPIRKTIDSKGTRGV